MTTRFRNYIFVILLIVILSISACGGGNSPGQELESQNNSIFESEINVVSATGKVVPETWVTISSPSAGIVVDLPIAENQIVNEGETLLKLSGSEQISALVSGAKLELLQAEQVLSDFLEIAPIVTAQAQQKLADSKNILNTAELTLDYLINGAKQSTIDQAEANKILRQDQLEKAQENFEKYEDRPKDDLVRANLQSLLGQAQADYDNALRYYNNLISNSNAIELAQGEADLALAQAGVNLAQIEYNKVANGPDKDTLILLEARIENAKAQLNAAQTALEDLSLTAPFSGTVSHLYIHQNEWVNPSQPILVIGDLVNLQIETTDLNEIDVSFIEIGQKATVIFDALKDVEVSAMVVDISSKASLGTGVNYKVTLALDEIPTGLFWDMTAFIDININ
ncbi:MAG: HlyD family efflux transporter periplasmic adaptor subunit [Chloroflexi bacterium]|jgi:multidrug efflux pump subunit AcrA (membrane-fusion protein)|nr:HlyD family efflux transporter periplasmic adaptor subunit [Chloroflexota bacterium]MBT3669458.1 HlyD family efflux transporter periplasmic adaptor subunit [Chloroflexota bacterium]MBT4304523.1 HlyD family efflux transporter periplasmic adaptor subunit [Chloroflexota bacterium]MBT4534136.1 HlyD family efflux transporter periplasmic adaptor subunit [Chloroflexota bacterium]MBT4683355.1 HlyD family efflux transporter periplasmic adaptor subunit [Chloroflexota bacterium]